jgi:hypothetical protein
MKSLVSLWREVAQEMATWCCTSTYRDAESVSIRTKNEGVSFLTITLSSYAKDFERSLEIGYVDPAFFRSFHARKNEAIPVFLQGMLGQVFDRKTGRLVAEPSVDCIRAIRQLTLMFSKIALPCTPSRNRKALQGFVDCEKEVREKNEVISIQALNELSTMSFLLYGNILDQVERKFLSDEILPKHGPGKTADRLLGNKKFDLSEWPARLNHSFPMEKFVYPNERFCYLSDRVNLLEPGTERPVKVTLVPKTLKTPRIIAIEPTAMQYSQQALLAEFVLNIESPYIPNDYFSSRRNRVFGMIGFSDQDPNRDLARQGSITGDLATLDLSEASDRVSNLHVMALFSRFPNLLIAIQDCRSTKADVPGFGVQHLSKFASMGSALCFPMEAMVFLAVIFLGIQDELNRPLTANDILSFAGKVRVFGDDLIIPKEMVPSVMNRLSLYGYKVNTTKSFWNGNFRESCGKEFFAGADVSLQRVRMELPSSRLDVQEIISLVSFRNRLFTAGFRDTVEYVDRLVEKVLPHYPLVRPTSPVLGRWSDHPLDFQVDRINQDTQSPMVKGYCVNAKPPISPISGEGSLLKFFLKRAFEPLQEGHLERQGRPESVNIKLRWSTPI